MIAIPKSAAGSLLGLFWPSSGLVRVDDDRVHFDGGVGLSATWPDVIHLPGVTVHSLVATVDRSGGL
jgi:hypothetical protein